MVWLTDSGSGGDISPRHVKHSNAPTQTAAAGASARLWANRRHSLQQGAAACRTTNAVTIATNAGAPPGQRSAAQASSVHPPIQLADFNHFRSVPHPKIHSATAASAGHPSPAMLHHDV